MNADFPSVQAYTSSHRLRCLICGKTEAELPARNNGSFWVAMRDHLLFEHGISRKDIREMIRVPDDPGMGVEWALPLDRVQRLGLSDAHFLRADPLLSIAIFCLAAVFPDIAQAGLAFDSAQECLRHHELTQQLTAYRILHRQSWHVLIIGAHPVARQIASRLQRILLDQGSLIVPHFDLLTGLLRPSGETAHAASVPMGDEDMPGH